MSNSTDVADRKGRGFPPEHGKFKKGGKPGPGRPKKKVLYVPVQADDFEKIVLEASNKLVSTKDGEITRAQAVFEVQQRDAINGNGKAARLVLSYTARASETVQKDRRTVLENAILYKRHWEPIFARFEKAGQPPPEQYPHPADVIIGNDGSVRIQGPMSAEQAKAHSELKKFIEVLVDDINEYKEDLQNGELLECGLRYWRSAYRRAYKFNKVLSPRHQVDLSQSRPPRSPKKIS